MEYVLFIDEAHIQMDIHTAASVGNDDRVRDIIESANDKEDIINAKNVDKWTPLMYAAQSGSQKVVLYLLEEGASKDSCNDDGQTALMLAAMYGHIESAFLLVDNGASINAADKDNWTALFYSVGDGHRGVVQLLLEKKCKVNLLDKISGMSPLMYAAAADHKLIASDLIQSGADVSLRNKKGQTAIDIAIQYGNKQVQAIIESHFKTNFIPSTVPNVASAPSTVEELLKNLGLSKYYPVFEKQAIDLCVFWTLTDADLKDIGLELLGPRRKITNEISRHQTLHKEKSSKDYSKMENFLQERIKDLNVRLVNMESQRKTAELKINHLSQVMQKYAGHFKMLQDKFFGKNNLKEVTVQTKQMILQEASNSQGHLSFSHETAMSTVNVFNIIEHFIREYKKIACSFILEVPQSKR